MDELLIAGAFKQETSSTPLEASLATVSSVENSGLKLIFDGAGGTDGKIYPCNAGVTFMAGDRVKVSKISGTYIAEYPIGDPGSRGGGGSGSIPSGGAVDNVLAKKTARDNDVYWRAIFPTGGTDGQVLTKDGTAEQKVKWAAAPSDAGSKLVNGDYSAVLDAVGNLAPKSTYYRGSLGTSNVPWTGLYTAGTINLNGTDINIGSSGSTAKIGFFGISSKSAKLTHSTTSNNQGYTTVTSSNLNTTGVYALNNIIGILKKYGLIG